MGRNTRYMFISTVIMLWSFVLCSAIPQKPSQERLVNDYAGIFSRQERSSLENALTDFYNKTSNQILVITVSDLEGMTSAEYATDLGHAWGVGGKKYDNGIVMLIKPKTRNSGGDAFIAVGYGLEGAIPDMYASEIVNNQMIPYFKQNNYFEGVVAGCKVLMGLASGEISEVPGGSGEGDSGALVIGLMFALFLLYFILKILDNKNRGDNGGNGGNNSSEDEFFGPVIFPGSFGGRSSGGFGGGGSFGGGFGGFGGGGFGGGGGGGKW